MKTSTRSYSAVLGLVAGQALAVGLGPVLDTPVIGEPLKVRIQLLGDSAQRLDSGCFRLQNPSTADLPVLKSARFAVSGSPGAQVLEVSHWQALQTPLLQMTIRVDCGNDVAREYVLLAAPPRELAKPEMSPSRAAIEMPVNEGGKVEKKPRVRAAGEVPPRRSPNVSRKTADSQGALTEVAPRSAPSPAGDQLRVSRDAGGGALALGFASDLASPPPAKRPSEDQLAILRLEYKLLQALSEQAGAQLETSEKLRELELSLTALQKRNVSQAESQTQAMAQAPKPATPPVAPSPPADNDDLPWWAAVLAALAGAGGWAAWRRLVARKGASGEAPGAFAELPVDPRRQDEQEDLGGEALPVEPAKMGRQAATDAVSETVSTEGGAAEASASGAVVPVDSVLSISAAPLDEQVEANPVMELADIMLSFGRVKGAAQALQEFIDHNPQEALQPWIRLMEVYRLAGMRDEFERVARNLNQHFNVEILEWDPPPTESPVEALDIDLDSPILGAERKVATPKPQSVEDMPRVLDQILSWWPQPDAVAKLHQLLRDNGGGTRLGFALPVVEEILFLIDIRQTVDRST